MQTEPSEAPRVSEAQIEAGVRAVYQTQGPFGSRGQLDREQATACYLAMKALDPDLARTDSPTDAVVQKMVRVINGNLTTGISMGQAERYADEDTALAVIAALPPVERLREALAPFAAVAEKDIGASEDDGDLFRPMGKYNHAPHLTVGHLRAALAALRNSTDGETK